MRDIYQPPPFDNDPSSGPKEPHYGPKDLILVIDTSFLIRLANNDLWANCVWHDLKGQAETTGKNFNFLISNEIIAEYEKMLAETRPDQYGIPFVHRPLEDMLGWQLVDSPMSLDPSANTAAQESWRKYVSKKKNPESHKVRSGANEEDLSVVAWARTIASHGADVYVPSYDFRDIIDPLRHDAENIKKEGLKITPMAPAPLQTPSVERLYCYKGNGNLSPMINHELSADLQYTKLHLGAVTYVIFEKNVKSGDTAFDVAVDVVELANQKEANRLTQNRGRFYAIPVIRLPHKHLRENVKIMRSYFGRSDPTLPYRLMVVDSGSARFFPVLISPGGKDVGWWRWYRPFHTTSDFLFHQTDSVHAKEHFRPNTRSARRR